MRKLFSSFFILTGLLNIFSLNVYSATCPSAAFYQNKGSCGSRPTAPFDSTCWCFCTETLTGANPCGTPGNNTDPNASNFSDIVPAPAAGQCAFPEAIQVTLTVRQAQSAPGVLVPFGQDLNFSLQPAQKTILVPVKPLIGRNPGP